MAKIKQLTDKHGEIVYPVSKETAIYDENGVLLSNKISTFITRLVDNLANYYLKSETYTKAEVNDLIGAIQGFSYIVVSELPIASAFTMGTIYLVPSEDPQIQNTKDEYITIRSGSIGSYTYSWEQIGSTAIDLSGYVTTEALNTALANYTTTANLTTLLAGKQDTISDLSTIRSGAAAGATAYQKPGTGIPATDMASGVQTSLGKADSAYQKPSSGIPKTDLESGVQDSLELADTAVQAEPIGSIVPPVDPSEFATNEEVSQLEAKVDGDGSETQVSPSVTRTYSLIDKVTGDVAYTSTSTSTVRDFILPEGVTEIKVSGRQGVSTSGCMVAFFKGDKCIGTDLPNTGTASNVVKQSVTLPKGTTMVRIAGSSSGSNQNGELYTIGTGVSGDVEYNTNSIEELQQENEPDKRASNTVSMLPIIYEYRYYAGIDTSTGAVRATSAGTTSVVRDFEIPAGAEKVWVNGRRGTTSGRSMIAYFNESTFISSDLPNGSTAKDVVGYESTVPSNATMIRVVGSSENQMPEVYIPGDSDVIDEYRELNILCIGNSYTYDALGYLPDIIRRALPKVKVNIAIMYQGHCSLQEHLDNLTNDTAYPSYSIYKWDSQKWYTQNTTASISQMLAVRAWDIILLQQNSANSTDYSTYQPYLNSIIDTISGMVSYPVKFGWILTPAWATGYSSLTETSDEMYEGIAECAERVLNETMVEFVIPVGTATQNARHTTLDSLGTFGHLTYDGTHLNEGIPCLIEAYTALLSFAKLTGDKFRSIFGEPTRPDDTWITAQDVPQTHGNSVGVTDSNVLLAQKCAVMADKHPFNITEI